MRKKLSFAMFLLIFITFFVACKNGTEPDTIPPQVSISFPANNSIVKDTVTIRATVADNEGVSKVEFLVDGIMVGSVNNSPYEFNWDTRQVTNGSHSLQCKAIDKSSNEGLSELVTVTVSNSLFKATFKNDWLSNDEQCIIFISDMDGNIFAEKSFTGNKSFEMFDSNGSNSDQITKINVTTVVYDGNRSFITTNLNIPAGSAWTLKGYPSPDYNTPYTVELNFQNIPEHEGYVLSSKWNSIISSSGTISSPYSFDFFESPMNIYLKTNTVNNGAKYIWIDDVLSGNRDVDLSNMSTATEKTINMNGANGYRKYLYGISNLGHRYEGRYRLDYGYDIDNSVNSINVYYPENYFSDYRTSLYYYDEIGNRDNFYYQSVYGNIPDAFTKINADFNFVNVSYDNFEILPSGEFIEIRSSWKDDNHDYWYIYGDKTDYKYQLPVLPNSVVQQFGLNRESFQLRYVDLIDHTELNSYSEIINILFNSDNYFYDVVNDFRSRLKYYNDGGNLLKNANEMTFPDTYEERCLGQ